MEDPREKANAYMEKHRITELFEELGTSLLYHRPEDLRKFLVEQLKATQKAKAKGKTVRSIHHRLLCFSFNRDFL